MRQHIYCTMLLAAAVASWATMARADQDYIKVQPIQVCDSAGANCAAVTLNESAVQQIYDQAGIAIQWAPTIQYDAPSTAVTYQAGLGLTTAVESSGGDATDQAHMLLRGYQEPPNPAPADPQVLNLFYVGALLRTDGGPINGLALIGGNGMIVADQSTGLGSSTGVPIDTPAHEIGHNLGLKDVDLANPVVVIPTADQPYNLMDSLSRITPPAGTISTDGTTGIDRLVPQQVNILRQPLFTIDGASAQISEDASSLIDKCGASFEVCDQLLTLPASSTTQTLTGVKLRYTDVGSVLGFVGSIPGDSNACAGTFGGEDELASGGYELSFSFGSGCLPGQDAILETNFETDSTVAPFSVEFDFSGGTTSTAVYSASGIANSTVNATYAINGPTAAYPGFMEPVTNDLDIDSTPVTGSLPTAVPEPPALLLMLTGMLALAVPLRASSLVRRPRGDACVG